VGSIAKGEFYAKAGAKAAHDGDDHFIYNKTNGNLYFDYDAKGGAGAVLIATITNHPGNFDYHDIQII